MAADKRRGYGTGSLTAAGVNRWRVQGVQRGADGKSHRFTRIVYGTKRDAERELRRLLGEAPAVEAAEVPTVAAIVEAFIARPGLAVTTVAEYRTCLDRFIRPAFGQLLAADVTPAMVESLYQSMRDAGLSESRVSKVHGMLSGAFGRSVRLGIASTSPIERVDPPSQRRAEPRVPSPADVARLMAAAEADGPLTALAVRLAAVSGARRGEVAGLQQADVTDDGAVTIGRSVAYTSRSGVVVKSTKSDRPRRIALDADTVAMIRELGESPYIFGGHTPWRPDRFTATFDRVRTKAGVDVHLHGLRHFMATRAIAAGVDVRTVAGRLGHANPATTLRVYSAFVPAQDRMAANLLADLITPGG